MIDNVSWHVTAMGCLVQMWTGREWQIRLPTPGSTSLVSFCPANLWPTCALVVRSVVHYALCAASCPACNVLPAIEGAFATLLMLTLVELWLPTFFSAAGEMSERLIDMLRRPQRSGCGNAVQALEAAPAAFLQQKELFEAAAAASTAAESVSHLEQLGRGVCRQLLLHQQEQPHYPGIGPECPLMARKFLDDTVKVRRSSWLLCFWTATSCHSLLAVTPAKRGSERLCSSTSRYTDTAVPFLSACISLHSCAPNPACSPL